MNNKDYNIIKIRIYADEKLMKDFDSEKCQQQHWERANSYFQFWMKLVEKVTDQPYEYWTKKFLFSKKYIDISYELPRILEKEYDIHVKRWWDVNGIRV